MFIATFLSMNSINLTIVIICICKNVKFSKYSSQYKCMHAKNFNKNINIKYQYKLNIKISTIPNKRRYSFISQCIY